MLGRVQLEQIKIAGTELKVSRICLGTMTFGGQASEADSIKIIERAFESGINFIDTANVYNGGASELVTGKALLGKRKRVVLASKVRGKMGEKPEDIGLSRGAIVKQIEASLQRLQTDYLDLYYLHQPDYDTPIDESLEAMEKVVKQGKVRYAAASNYAAWQMAQMQCIAAQKGYQPIRVTQPMYNLLARGIEQEFLPMCKEYGTSTFVYNPLAGGLLTGKQSATAPIEGTRFHNNQMYLDRYWHPAFFEAVEELKAIAEKANRSLVSLSLNWVLHHTAATGMILGASRIEHLTSNLQSAEEGPLAEDTVAECDGVWTKLRGVTPKYNR
jgi:aryl-alcohol dehydrogenase-like predicted oxidoreductase